MTTINTKPKVDLARLPPPQVSFFPHIQQVNHRVAVYKRANEAIFWRPILGTRGRGGSGQTRSSGDQFFGQWGRGGSGLIGSFGDKSLGQEVKIDEVILDPILTIGPILPPSLMDILERTVEENEK